MTQLFLVIHLYRQMAATESLAEVEKFAQKIIQVTTESYPSTIFFVSYLCMIGRGRHQRTFVLQLLPYESSLTLVLSMEGSPMLIYLILLQFWNKTGDWRLEPRTVNQCVHHISRLLLFVSKSKLWDLGSERVESSPHQCIIKN